VAGVSDIGADIARLEVQVSHLISSLADLKRDMAGTQSEVRGIRATLDESRGGVMVLRWFGFGSFASILAAAGALAVWLKAQ